MTEIEKKALALVNGVVGSGAWTLTSLSHPYNRVVFTALCRAIEQHEALQADKAKLREALERVLSHRYGDWTYIARKALQETER